MASPLPILPEPSAAPVAEITKIAPAALTDRRPANIADPFQDLLSALGEPARRGLVQRLSTGYYEGWRPSRSEIADLVSRELGWITEDQYLARLPAFRLGHQPRNDLAGQHPRRPVTETPALPGPVGSTAGRAMGVTARFNRPDAGPASMRSFSVDCGELLASFSFVARGVSSGGWVQRAGRMYRLIALHYELVPRAAAPEVSAEPVGFTAMITCVPGVAAPLEPGDGQRVSHALRAGRVVGVRGQWPVSRAVRQLVFLIYPQATPNDAVVRHPAGALRVDLISGAARWQPTTDRQHGRIPATARRVLRPEEFMR